MNKVNKAYSMVTTESEVRIYTGEKHDETGKIKVSYQQMTYSREGKTDHPFFQKEICKIIGYLAKVIRQVSFRMELTFNAFSFP